MVELPIGLFPVRQDNSAACDREREKVYPADEGERSISRVVRQNCVNLPSCYPAQGGNLGKMENMLAP
jgi:hypothetical protein